MIQINAGSLMNWIKMNNLDDRYLSFIELQDGRLEVMTSRQLSTDDVLEYVIVFSTVGLVDYTDVKYLRYVYDDKENLDYWEEPVSITEAEADDLVNRYYKKVS